MNKLRPVALLIALLLAFCPALAQSGKAQSGKAQSRKEEEASLKACAERVLKGARKIANTRGERFEGKVSEATALCRGGQRALQFRNTPWVDWSQYWGTGDAMSRTPGLITKTGPSFRGVNGALIDLEYQRMELIKFNLFDNNRTYTAYVTGRDNVAGAALKTWPEMRLPKDHPNYQDVGGDGKQVCKGDLVRARTVTGICNDVLNPLMGSTGQMFTRNVEFDTTFPEEGRTELTRNRHGDRLGLLKPDPQVISRRLFTRKQSNPDACREGYGLPGDSPLANCDYQKAPFFNVLAAYWIQFMTHDWFSHLEEGHNQPDYMKVGCETQLVNGVQKPLPEEEVRKLGCRPDDRIDKSYVAADSDPEKFSSGGKEYLARAPKIARNTSTAWWDASQIYGYDDRSRQRVKRDPADRARLAVEPNGYLPVFADNGPINPEWKGQESSGFPDNWTIGLSFYHNVFTREHNSFVSEFRKTAAQKPTTDSGLRNPSDPQKVIRYQDVTPDELFEVTRLVVSAEIAKIHTTEWTPQLLYNDPLYKGMNANWSGLLGEGGGEISKILSNIIVDSFGTSRNAV
jgi:hypothetical protein